MTQSQHLTGHGRYADDLARPDALHAWILRSDVPHARVEEVDISEAIRLPGVHAVLSAEQLPTIPRIPLRVGPTDALNRRLQPVLAADRVRYVGEPLAIVIAESPSLARDAGEMIRVELSMLPEIGDPRTATADSLWDEPLDNIMIELRACYGETEPSLLRSATVVQEEFVTSRRTGLPIEARSLVAEWIGDDLHLWGPTKFIHFTRRSVAHFFGVDPDNVICHRVDVGGMFGVRGEVYPEDFLIPWAARLTGRMVRWQEQRREHLLSINHAGEQYHIIKMGVSADGTFLALHGRTTLDMGAYARPIGSRLPHIVVETLPGPYRWEALDLECRGVATNRTPVGTIRGPAAFETAFVRERLIDIAARRMGVDPVELRRHNLVPATAMPFRIPFESPTSPITYDSGDYPTTLRNFESAIDVSSITAEVVSRRKSGQRIGLGWAFTTVHSGLGKEESVRLELTNEGQFVLNTSAVEVGQGLDQTIRSLVAAEVPAPRDAVTVRSGDSAAHSEGNGTFSSRSTIFVGSATVLAVEILKTDIATRAGTLLGCAPDEVSFSQDGPFRGHKSLNWKDVAPASVVGRFRMDDPTYGFAVHLAMVSIDSETGDVTVEKIWVGYDCGKAIDHCGTRDQIVGGAVAGLSGAIYERLAFDSGVPLSASLVDYIVARATDVPDIHVELFEEPSPGNPLGARGVGEAGTIGIGGAVANAVADALGDSAAPVTTLPLNPEAVFSLLGPPSRSGGP